MRSAGNDIVALNAVDTQRSVSPQFYSKFIIPSERELYEQSSVMKTVSFCSFVWLLWSVKEAAYKYCKRQKPDLIFSPSKFVVERIESCIGFLEGTVTYQGVSLYFNSWITDDYIETIVDYELLLDDYCSDVYHNIIKIDKSDRESQSAAVRALLKQDLLSAISLKDFDISKDEAGCPIIITNGIRLAIDLSFAHHDCFVGYSYKL